MKATTLALALALLPIGCTQPSCAAFGEHAGPELRTILARVDVARLLGCRDAGDAGDVARCLGAEAMTQGLQIAVDRALEYADAALMASNPGAGAADVTDAERDTIAAELDASLVLVAQEIAAANGE